MPLASLPLCCRNHAQIYTLLNLPLRDGGIMRDLILKIRHHGLPVDGQEREHMLRVQLYLFDQDGAAEGSSIIIIIIVLFVEMGLNMVSSLLFLSALGCPRTSSPDLYAF